MAEDESKLISELAACIADESAPAAKRIQTCFILKTKFSGSKAIEALTPGLKSPSVLLAHEIAYVLGQMRNEEAVPALTAALENKEYDPIVRHEAAEALAAIGLEESTPILIKYCDDPHPEVSETCQIAVDRINWRKEHPEAAESEKDASHFHSVDPAPGHSKETLGKSVEDLQKILLDSNLSLFKRYQAMFTLRNIADEASVNALCLGFKDKSALFRHEVAYVLGQLQHSASVPALIEVLKNDKEHPMVRHEAAEALGEISHDACTPLLEQFQKDDNRIVAESCDVALSIADYWSNFDKADDCSTETQVC